MSETNPVSVHEQGETIKPSITAVVPSEGVIETGFVDYMFMINADVPRELLSGRPFGILKRAAKGPGYVNPFKLARGESGAVGDDGTPLWYLNLGRGDRQTIAVSAEADEAGEGLVDLMKNVPDCVVLVPPADIEALQAANAARVEVISYLGFLSTSY